MVDDVEEILNRPIITKDQVKMVKILSLLKEILKSTDKKTDEQPDTTNMPELESELSAEQRRNKKKHGLKMLTPNQMLSKLPISLAQLKVGNN